MPRVLIVEDSLSTRSFVRTALEDCSDALGDPQVGDIEVIEAAGGFEALRLLPRGHYDLVITDINMPDINGLELVRFLRESEHHAATPILLISTQAAQRDRERGLSLGANGFLAKPFTAEELRAKVLHYLGLASAQQSGA